MNTEERLRAEKALAHFKNSIDIKDYGLALIQMHHQIEYAQQQVKNLHIPDVSVSVCDKCENKSLCNKHGVLGINCIRLAIKQTER